jgi:anti-sigma regulatory factor (Ser/Thr protein kinase)
VNAIYIDLSQLLSAFAASTGEQVFLATAGSALMYRSDAALWDTLSTVAPEVVQRGQGLTQAVVDQVMAFAGPAPQFDDMTLMVLHYQPPPALPVLELALAPDLSELERLRAAVADFCEHQQLPAELVFLVDLVSDEWFSNLLRHGYAPEALPAAAIGFCLRLEPGRAVLELRDNAPPFDPLQAPEPDLDLPLADKPIGGLGIHLIRNLMDTVAYRREDGCNLLIVSKNLPPDGDSREAAEAV